jgi:hypothetical protein
MFRRESAAGMFLFMDGRSDNWLERGSSPLSVSGDDVPCPPACDDDSGAADEAEFLILSSFAANSGCGHLRLDAFCLAVFNMDER